MLSALRDAISSRSRGPGAEAPASRSVKRVFVVGRWQLREATLKNITDVAERAATRRGLATKAANQQLTWRDEWYIPQWLETHWKSLGWRSFCKSFAAASRAFFWSQVHLSASQVKDFTEVFRASLGCLRADDQLSGRTTNRRTGVPGTLITRDSCFMLFLFSWIWRSKVKEATFFQTDMSWLEAWATFLCQVGHVPPNTCATNNFPAHFMMRIQREEWGFGSAPRTCKVLCRWPSRHVPPRPAPSWPFV